jgi:hypothetical protein
MLCLCANTFICIKIREPERLQTHPYPNTKVQQEMETMGYGGMHAKVKSTPCILGTDRPTCNNESSCSQWVKDKYTRGYKWLGNFCTEYYSCLTLECIIFTHICELPPSAIHLHYPSSLHLSSSASLFRFFFFTIYYHVNILTKWLDTQNNTERTSLHSDTSKQIDLSHP